MEPDSIDWPIVWATPAISILVLIALSAVVSAVEAAFLNLNRYRLRNLVRIGNLKARRIEGLLVQPDRVATTFLLCRTALHAAAAAIAGTMTFRLASETAFALLLAFGIACITLLIVILGDIAPRAFGARFAERIALPASWVCQAIFRTLQPATWLVEKLSHGFLRGLGVTPANGPSFGNDPDPTAPGFASAHTHQRMLARILELQSVTVEDIMIPRSEISSVDINDDWDTILDQLRTTPHTRLPLCENNLDNVVGMLHMKKVAHALAHGALSREILLGIAREREAYFVPEGTTLDVQLQNFQRDRRRIALVVDEYGDIRGLVTLEDILEEIVGEFTSDPGTLHRDIHRDADGSYVVNGAINVRVLNRTLGWSLPAAGPRTLNGLILEYLENIPHPGTSLTIGGLTIEILQTIDNAVKTARIRPAGTDSDDHTHR
ncbi:HlyC/CorC family transporter [Povalibacter sp.]|uniref:HlyC/CorC family transporter n=1 Tax=Povalibacter sp. TaxID=1962978 RepID=UPI002F3FCA4B